MTEMFMDYLSEQHAWMKESVTESLWNHMSPNESEKTELITRAGFARGVMAVTEIDHDELSTHYEWDQET